MECASRDSLDTSPKNTGAVKSTLLFKNPAMQQLVQQVEFLDDYVRQVLELTHGNRTHAAKFLGWSLNRLYRWLKTHGMK